jgi:hypothetical protein
MFIDDYIPAVTLIIYPCRQNIIRNFNNFKLYSKFSEKEIRISLKYMSYLGRTKLE